MGGVAWSTILLQVHDDPLVLAERLLQRRALGDRLAAADHLRDGEAAALERLVAVGAVEDRARSCRRAADRPSPCRGTASPSSLRAPSTRSCRRPCSDRAASGSSGPAGMAPAPARGAESPQRGAGAGAGAAAAGALATTGPVVLDHHRVDAAVRLGRPLRRARSRGPGRRCAAAPSWTTDPRCALATFRC